MSELRLIFLALLAFTLPACSLYKAKVDLQESGEMVTFLGNLETPDAASPAVVGLFREQPSGKSLAAYFVRYGSGPFRFIVPAGKYHLFAYGDANANLKYDTGEAIYYEGDRQPPTTVASGADHDFGTIRMSVRNLDVADLRMAAQRDLASSAELASFHRGTIVKWDDPRFEGSSGPEGMWTPLRSVATHGAGLFFLDPYDPARIPVIFVHGMSGTARDLKDLAEKVDRKRFQPWFFQYPSGIRLSLASELLQAMISEMRARHGFDRYAVVAHSMGGLVSRAALLRIQRDGGRPPSLFLTISTPWGGHAAADTGVKRSPVVVPAWIDMAPGSLMLKTLFDKPLDPATSTYLLFGYSGGNGSDGTVSLKSMLRPEAQDQAIRVLGFPEDHMSILESTDVAKAVGGLLGRAIPAGGK